MGKAAYVVCFGCTIAVTANAKEAVKLARDVAEDRHKVRRLLDMHLACLIRQQKAERGWGKCKTRESAGARSWSCAEVDVEVRCVCSAQANVRGRSHCCSGVSGLKNITLRAGMRDGTSYSDRVDKM